MIRLPSSTSLSSTDSSKTAAATPLPIHMNNAKNPQTVPPQPQYKHQIMSSSIKRRKKLTTSNMDDCCRLLTTLVATLLLLIVSLFNASSVQSSFGFNLKDMDATTTTTASDARDVAATALIASNITTTASNRFYDDDDLEVESVPFTMCERATPFSYDVRVDPSLPPSLRRRPLPIFDTRWPRDNKLLLLRSDPGFGHVGNQFNSILHALDYCRDNRLDLGILFHSWAMDTIQTMFYETSEFLVLEADVRRDLGILVVRNQTQLEDYDEVQSMNAQKLYFYRSSHDEGSMDSWKETMRIHVAFLRQLYLRYNRGYGYVHNGLRAPDTCEGLDSFFHGRGPAARYTVIHSRFLDGNAEWRLEKLAKTVGITVEGGALTMAPAYVKSILKPLEMLDHPIILLSDGQLPSVERGLLNDPVLGPNMMVLSGKVALEGSDVALAVLADVFIGNPASVTSGFIARSRFALGYSEESTQLFRRKRIHQWHRVCNDECVFNPWMLGQWV